MSTKNPTAQEINAALDDYRAFRGGRPIESGRMAIVKNTLAAAFWESQGDGWRDIATAPKDGTPFLILTSHGDMVVARCGSGDHWVTLPGFWAIKKPRLWQPLPAPPANDSSIPSNETK